MTTKPNEPIFPQLRCLEASETHNTVYYNDGLTKRELFAAMALQGFCSWDINKGKMPCDYNNRVDQAVKAADALIAALVQDSKRSE
jgi:hypothetical protein